MSEPLYLRPHHALCIRFFVGKGYSEKFVRHMTAVVEKLQRDDPVVTLAGGCDVICEKCPHNRGGACDTSDKVRAIDDRALSAMELHVGETLRWHDLYRRAYDRIIGCSRLTEVCRDCQWLNLCKK